MFQLENLPAEIEILVTSHTFEGQRTRQGCMASAVYVMYFIVSLVYFRAVWSAMQCLLSELEGQKWHKVCHLATNDSHFAKVQNILDLSQLLQRSFPVLTLVRTSIKSGPGG
jgi:hypothetical protein